MKRNDGIDSALALLKSLALAQSYEEYCKQIVHLVLHKYPAVGASLCSLKNDATIEWHGSYGDWKGEALLSILKVWNQNPIGVCLRSGNNLTVSKSAKDAKYKKELDWPGETLYLLPFGAEIRKMGLVMIALAAKNSDLEMPRETISLIQAASGAFVFLHSGSTRSRFLNSQPDVNLTALSAREIEILIYMSRGMTNREIGLKLHLSESTIKQDSVKIFRKLHSKNRFEAVSRARQEKLI